jgi:hypothetical protein
MKVILRLTVLLASLVFSLNCFAWNALGHKVIASIAYDNLTPAARTKIDDMIATFAKEYPAKNSMIEISTWADEIRSDNINLYTHWHYIDKAFSTDGTPIKDISDTDNVVWALTNIEAGIKNPKINPYEQARLLVFLVHFAADIHQPLHTTSRISQAHPNGDEGGNLFLFGTDAASANLHSLWDSGCNLFTGDATDKKIAALELLITTQYPQEYFGKEPQDLTVTDWAQEGFDAATNTVYQTPENQAPSDTYLSTGKDLSEQKAALAGYRLANLLNKLFG